MSLVKKLKDILFEVEEEDTEEIKVVEEPVVAEEPVKNEEVVLEEPKKEVPSERELFKSENNFKFPDFDEEKLYKNISFLLNDMDPLHKAVLYLFKGRLFYLKNDNVMAINYYQIALEQASTYSSELIDGIKGAIYHNYAFLLAKENKFDYFTTTLTVSPHKNSKLINQIGEEISKNYNIKWLYSDFKKNEGYKQTIELSKKYDLYRQDYCGCIYSKEERKKQELTHTS